MKHADFILVLQMIEKRKTLMGLIGLLVMGGGHPAPTPGIVFLERGSLESTEAK